MTKTLPLTYYIKHLKELNVPEDQIHDLAKIAAELHIISVEKVSILGGPILLEVAYKAARDQLKEQLV